MSDKDFFFEDDEVVEEASKPSKPEPKRTSKPAAPKPAVKQAAAVSGGSFLDQSVTMQVTVLIAVVALLVGVIVGFLIAPRSTPVASIGSAGATSSMGGSTGGGSAPALSEDQLNQGMPAGHPPIENSTETSATE